MSTFGITAIRWNADRGEVASCRMHKIDYRDGAFVLLEGKVLSFGDIADSILSANEYFAIEQDVSGHYEKRGFIVVKDGQKELLGSLNNSLFELPTF